jgi:hypothetical protein
MEALLRVTIYCDRTAGKKRISMETIGNQQIFTIWGIIGAIWFLYFMFILGTTGIGFNKAVQKRIIEISNLGGILYQFLNIHYYHRSSVFGIRFMSGVALVVSILGLISFSFESFKLNINIGLVIILAVISLIMQFLFIWVLAKIVEGIRKGRIKRGWAVGVTEMLLITNRNHYKSWFVAAIVLHIAFISKCCLSM